MPNRREFDVPAALIAGVLGVVVVLVSGPFTYFAYAEVTDKGVDYLVNWKETSTTQTLASPAPSPAIVHYAGQLPGTVHVHFTSCTDSADGQTGAVQGKATITVVVTRTMGGKTTEVGRRAATCAQANSDGMVYMNTTKHPDVGTVKGKDQAGADKALADKVATALVDATYTVTLSTSRAAGTVPQVGNQGATLSANVEVTGSHWDGTAVKKEAT